MRQITPSISSGLAFGAQSKFLLAPGARAGAVLMVACLALLAAGAVVAQDLALGSTTGASTSGGTPAVLAMSEADETLEITVGHSMLLQAEEPLGTIIVGDDTVATATLGAGSSIILTGLAAGSTNLLVLTEEDEILLSTQLAVVPVTGRLRSTVTVLKGSETREQYECRGNACEPVDADRASSEAPLVLTVAPSATAGTDDPSAD